MKASIGKDGKVTATGLTIVPADGSGGSFSLSVNGDGELEIEYGAATGETITVAEIEPGVIAPGDYPFASGYYTIPIGGAWNELTIEMYPAANYQEIDFAIKNLVTDPTSYITLYQDSDDDPGMYGESPIFEPGYDINSIPMLLNANVPVPVADVLYTIQFKKMTAQTFMYINDVLMVTWNNLPEWPAADGGFVSIWRMEMNGKAIPKITALLVDRGLYTPASGVLVEDYPPSNIPREGSTTLVGNKTWRRVVGESSVAKSVNLGTGWREVEIMQTVFRTYVTLCYMSIRFSSGVYIEIKSAANDSQATGATIRIGCDGNGVLEQYLPATGFDMNSFYAITAVYDREAELITMYGHPYVDPENNRTQLFSPVSVAGAAVDEIDDVFIEQRERSDSGPFEINGIYHIVSRT